MLLRTSRRRICILESSSTMVINAHTQQQVDEHVIPHQSIGKLAQVQVHKRQRAGKDPPTHVGPSPGKTDKLYRSKNQHKRLRANTVRSDAGRGSQSTSAMPISRIREIAIANGRSHLFW